MFKKFAVPVARREIHQHGARGVSVIGDVDRAVREFPDQPGIDVAEENLAIPGSLVRAGHVFQYPADFAAGEIGVDDQPGPVGDRCSIGRTRQFRAEVSCAAALPDNGGRDRLAGLAVPNDCGFPLIGDAARGDIAGADVLLQQHGAGGVNLRPPDGSGILLHPAGMRVKAFERNGMHGDSLSVFVVKRGARAGGSFIERKHERHPRNYMECPPLGPIYN